ncbi:hypothetical protein [Bradyrhizobium sp. ARR65]|uniref:hypothetical protein n=1 Tax=Bradyrhizobium sp. ARR65 TaxID=1040989 RepID=UPI0004661D84|nr:hypothetical protein [Bradyrhizobium sp. ARR65]
MRHVLFHFVGLAQAFLATRAFVSGAAKMHQVKAWTNATMHRSQAAFCKRDTKNKQPGDAGLFEN